ncbi:hypothetical protein ACH5RR_007951 [Cinchona calisaya]|uniref:AT1G17665-like protein n=1 Tax=Cinchona calisaya TaxID=153742 RepID=A0ABD3AA79_9GENT
MLIFLLILFIFFFLSLFSFSIFIFSRKFSHPKALILKQKQTQQFSLVKNEEKGGGSDPTRLTRTILVEVLPADSPKWAELFKDEDPGQKGSALDGDEKKKKRKKRVKKKRPDPISSGGGRAGEEERKKDNDTKKEEFVCLCPFTTSSSAVQRKLKQHYDQLVNSHQSNTLTLVQVGQFVNCLVVAKDELKHRSDAVQRKFTITKALLLKADRSSFDRLRQQIYKLELEQRRLEDDAFVYNWLQQQLKVSPAYKKILEIGACMEMEGKHQEEVESTDNEISDISFEELLAKEKKDTFWQRNGKSRSCYSGQQFC